MQTKAVDFTADNAGRWLFQCHINGHHAAGMSAFYEISGPAPTPSLPGFERAYYIGAVEIPWSYAPRGQTNCTGQASEVDMERNFAPSLNMSSFAYKKVVYKEFVDSSFTVEKLRHVDWSHLGLTGPLLRAAVGDTIVVYFKNMASQFLSMHPHGLWYSKDSEGTPYADGTMGKDRADDSVPPGSGHIYRWLVPERAGPGPRDKSSIAWMYHSGTNEAKDIYSGAIGAIIITAKGQATSSTENLKPRGVDREFVLFFGVMDEGRTFYTSENRANYRASVKNRTSGFSAMSNIQADEIFQESALVHQINGRTHCNLDGLVMTVGERVRFYFYALGAVRDMHTPSFDSMAMNWQGRTTGSSMLQPGITNVVDVTAVAPGSFTLQCHVNAHMASGMNVRYTILGTPAANLGTLSKNAKQRNYFIQAEDILWNYVPLGYDGCTGAAFDDVQKKNLLVDGKVGQLYTKAVFREYTDLSFIAAAARPPQLGLLGPTLHGEIGDWIHVVFKNTLNFSVNLFLGGGLVRLQGCDSVASGAMCEYTWAVPATSGPGPADLSTVAYTYLSTVDRVAHTHAGLVGAVIVGSRGSIGVGDLPIGANLEIPLLFSIQDEGLSPYLSINLAGAAASQNLQMHSVNGFLYCNAKILTVPFSHVVRWVLMAFGSENDIHTPHFENHVIKYAGMNHFVSDLMPANTMVVDMVASKCSAAEISCAVHDHYAAGMRSRFLVTGCAVASRFASR
jgi:hephaestin